VADHDAGDRLTLRESGIYTIPAKKAVKHGIERVGDRLRVNPVDGRPRLFVLRDSLVSRDDDLAERKIPVCTEQEFTSYVWHKGADGKATKEEPVKLNDHGMDALRYAVMYADNPQSKMRVVTL
jgi:phage terminase large subunit